MSSDTNGKNEVSLPMMIALLGDASQNIIARKQDQWSAAYYALLAEGVLLALVIYEDIKLPKWMLVVMAWLVALVLVWILFKTHYTMAKHRQRMQEIRKDDPSGTMKVYVKEKGPIQDREFPTIFSLAIFIGAAIVQWQALPNIGMLATIGAWALVFAIAFAIIRFARANYSDTVSEKQEAGETIEGRPKRKWRFVPLVLVVGGLAVWGFFSLVEPITLDNMRWHLTVTGIAAVLVGVGFSGMRIGRWFRH